VIGADRWAGVVVPAALAALAVWSAAPFAAWWGVADPGTVAATWQTWALGSLLALLLSALALALTRGRAASLVPGAARRLGALPERWWVGGLAVLLAAESVAACLFLFAGNPRNVDGFAQLFQARIFLAGRLWMPPPPELAHFGTLQMILGPDRWLSQYPPGQPLLLAAALAAGAWWILNPLLAGLLVVATYRVARWCWDEPSARLGAALLCLSPFVVAIAGSEMSHLPAATLGMWAAAFATRAGGPRPALWAGASGAALGLMAAFRPLDAAAAAAPVAAILALVASRRTAPFLAAAAAAALATLPTLWFNAAAHGSWLEFGYTRLWGPQHALGFHPTPWGTPLTPARAVALTGHDLHQLSRDLFDFPVPLLVVIAAGFLARRQGATSRDFPPLLGVAALSGLLFFYFHRDVLYGPRFLFSAAPWWVLLLARAWVLIARSGRAVRGGVTTGHLAAFALAAALVLGLVTILPGRLAAYRSSTPVFNLHPDRQAAREGISHAVVLVPDGWGQRLIARMWALGVPVWRSTRLYAAVDACALELALAAAETHPARRQRILGTLDSLAALNRPGVRAGLTEDPNLRLPASGDLPEGCRAELEFDRRGFLQFAPFLYLNQPGLDGDIVWARDLFIRNEPLVRRYPDRRFYRWAPQRAGGSPLFTPLERAGGERER
jgi:hypothetical protein